MTAETTARVVAPASLPSAGVASGLAGLFGRGLILGAALLAGQVAATDIYQPGYMRSDGTVIQPYYRAVPDRLPHNAYTAPGVINPYTGRPGSERQEPPPATQPYQPVQPSQPAQPSQTAPYR